MIDSLYAKCLVSYRPPRRVIEEYGYAVDFVDQVLCSMHGSGEGHTAYFYMRNNTPPRTPKLPQQQLLTLPLKAKQQQEGQLQQEECKQQQQQEQEQVYADKVFFTASKLAVGPTADLVAYVDGEMAKYVEGARPKRERKQRIITDASAF